MTDQLSSIVLTSLAGLIASGLLTAAVIPPSSGRGKNAGKILRASQARLAGILDIADDAIISIDGLHRITLFNQGAERIFGYSAEEVLGRSLDLLLPGRFAVVHNNHLAEFAGSPETARKMGGRREIFGLRKDGSEFPAEASISKLEFEGEKIFTVILRDIGERKRAEEVIRASQARLAGILDIADDAIISIDGLHRITLFNQGAERIFGYSAEEVLGRSLDLLLPGRFAAVHNNHLAEFAGSPETARKMGGRREIFGLRKDGMEFPAEASISKLDLEGEKIFTVMLRDITERKRAEEVIRASQARLAGILDTADDAIISLDKNQAITLFNQGAEKIFGYTAQEVFGKPLDAILPARFTDVHLGHISEFARSGETARKMGERRDIFGRRKDGTEFPAEASISKLELEGETTFTAILREITERKRIEQALVEKNVELEKAILVKDRFLASMSHELRTPLNAIIGFTGTLLMKLPGPLNDNQEKQLQTIQTGAGHLLSLIGDLLDLAKLESGKVQLNFEPVSCDSVIEEVVTTLRPLAETKGLRFEVNLSKKNFVVMTDRRALTQILINLTSNAIKFTESGRVSVELERSRHDGRSLTRISVVDTGIGIRAEDQEKMFEAFTQVEAMGERRYEGSGLGLHLSRKLANLLGASLSLESEFGKGSNFTLVLEEK